MILNEMIELCKNEMIAEGKENYFTGEKNILITYDDLKKRIGNLNDEYIKTLDMEFKVFKSNQILRTAHSGQITIPDWDLFITQLDSFTIVRITPPLEDNE